ncbi:Holliday junction DNA helicase RuvB C-terminal domain-containing protein, partial [Francisella tularensis]|uniref:Holliday junction DNA helicase RuvB C-terminal domain-containing protein n=1 Tax=Francisella tularensis TaxID=263 RepID=UPI0023EA5D1F
GWGTSRFAVDYNNYFGLHCFEENCGVKAKDSDVQVETFKDVGFDHMDHRYLLTLMEKFAGGPVGLDTMSAALSEEKGTIEDV